MNHEIAVDSREIAAASRRDSSAMKIIAVLTTTFLPGTFIAVCAPKNLPRWWSLIFQDTIRHASSRLERHNHA